MLVDLVVIVLSIIALRIVWRLVGGLIRLLLVAAVVASAVFYFAQPAAVPPSLKAHVAVHHVIAHEQTLAHHLMPRWRALFRQVEVMMHSHH